MSLFSKIAEVATGGLGKTILETIEKYLPPDLSPAEKAAIALETEKIELQRAAQVATAQNDAERALNERISSLEGTASDLKSLPILGPILLFARGAQRPIWGFATLYLDYKVFSGAWTTADPTITNAFWVINILVLGFLFGERAIINILPILSPFFSKVGK